VVTVFAARRHQLEATLRLRHCAKAPFSALRAIVGDVSPATFDEYSLVRRAARQDVEQR
jgi:hypothetical protein